MLVSGTAQVYTNHCIIWAKERTTR